MSNYTIVTNFLAKDSLASGNPAKLIKGADFTTEFTAVQTAINSKPDGSVQFFPDGSATTPSIGFTNNAGTGMYNVAGVLDFATASTLRLSITVAGGVVVAVPTSGVALSVGSTTNGLTAAGIGVFTISTGVSFISGAGEIASGNPIILGTSTAATVSLYTNNVSRLAVGVSGAVSIAAPSATVVGLTLTGAANADALLVQSSTTSGQAFGLEIHGGTNASDFALSIANAAATSTFFQVKGTGQAVYNDGASNLLEVGFRDIPQNNQPNNYTTVLTDRGKHILHSSVTAHTYTIDDTLAYPVGTALTFLNPNAGGALSIAVNNSASMFLSGAAATTGTRTLTAVGMATAIKQAANTWVISGTNLS